MLSRREVLIGAAATGAAALVRPATIVLASASQPSTPVNFEVPAGACDSHTHIFGDPQRFSFTPARVYTPEPASIDEMRSLHRALHTDRVVVVHPSVYGTDNACTLDAIRQFGSSARGIAVIDDKTSDTSLDEMDRGGIRGIRINLETAGLTDPTLARQCFKVAIERIRGRNWHVQIYTRLSVIESLAGQVLAAPVPVVFDHFGGAQAALGIQQPGFDTLVKLVQKGKAYVKISAAYRISKQAPDYPDVAPLAKALIAANPQRILWGTDWPHPAQIPGRKPTEITPLLQIDDGCLFNQLAVWAPDAAQRKTILVDNPAKLYRF
ncbi:MAG: amidohydrolase family protein [Candidatus Acidiferrales bacterium]